MKSFETKLFRLHRILKNGIGEGGGGGSSEIIRTPSESATGIVYVSLVYVIQVIPMWDYVKP